MNRRRCGGDSVDPLVLKKVQKNRDNLTKLSVRAGVRPNRRAGGGERVTVSKRHVLLMPEVQHLP
jgi:hypothetical protein